MPQKDIEWIEMTPTEQDREFQAHMDFLRELQERDFSVPKVEVIHGDDDENTVEHYYRTT